MEKTKNFEFPIVAVNQGDYENIQKWISVHKCMLMKKQVYIYGAGIRGNLFLKILNSNEVKIAGFIDGSKEKQGGFVDDLPIVSLQALNKAENVFILVSPENNKEILQLLEDNNYKKDKDYDVIESLIYPDYIKEYKRVEGIEYLFFGDCFFPDLDINDLGQMSLGDMVKEKLGTSKTKVLTLHGMCTPSFYHIMKEQLELGVKPKVVSFIINVPFCGGIQTKLPQSQHALLLEELAKIHRTEDFSSYVELAKERAKNINQKSFSTQSRDKDPLLVEKMLTKMRYMYPYDEKNENIVYAIKLIHLLRENNIKAKPFIPALHYKAGQEFWGEAFTKAYDAICDGIKGTLSANETEILDMSYLLDESMFFGNHMTKFPNREGKDKVIDTLISYVLE